MTIAKIKKGDHVIVIAGRDKGRHGKVLMVHPELQKVVVENVQQLTHYVKNDPKSGKQGGLIKKEAPIHISNVAIYNPETGKADKVIIKLSAEGKKQRYFKSTDKSIEV